MPRVVHFQICADDMQRAGKFYADVFDWQLEQWEGDGEFWQVKTGADSEPGIDGGLLLRHEPAAITTTLVMQVPSIDDYTAKIIASGGVLTIPRFAIPGVGYAAYFKDTEDNPIGIFEEDSAAG